MKVLFTSAKASGDKLLKSLGSAENFNLESSISSSLRCGERLFKSSTNQFIFKDFISAAAKNLSDKLQRLLHKTNLQYTSTSKAYKPASFISATY